MRIARLYRGIDAYRRNDRRDLGADYLYLYDGDHWLVYGIPNEAGLGGDQGREMMRKSCDTPLALRSSRRHVKLTARA